MTDHPILANDAALTQLAHFFDVWCYTDDVPSMIQRIATLKSLHDKATTATATGGWCVNPRNVPINIGRSRDDADSNPTDLARELLGLARTVSLSTLRNVVLNSNTTSSSTFFPSDASSFGDEPASEASNVGDSPPPRRSVSVLERTVGPDESTAAAPTTPAPVTRRPRQTSVAGHGSMIGSPRESSDKSRRDMAKALGDMTAMYLNAVQRQWSLERQLLLQEAELNETKDALEAARNASGGVVGVPSQHSSTFLNNTAQVAIAAARVKLFTAARDRGCLSPDGGLRSPKAASSPSQFPLMGPSLGTSGSATNFGEVASFASMGFFARHPVQVNTAKAVVSAQAEADGSTTLNQYILLAEVGAGSQGKVILAVDTESGETRAIKEIPRPRIQGPGIRSRMDNARQLSQLQREIAIMKRCRHKNVVRLFEVIDDPEAANLYLVMQYIEHGPIARMTNDGRTKPIEPHKLASYARQLCAGLHYLHGRRVVHKDIKPENILLGANDNVFLADFGISSFEEETDDQPLTLVTAPSVAAGSPSVSLSMSEAFEPHRSHNQHGTLVFRAPELLSIESGRSSRFEPADVWALGLSLYVMLYGCLPWPVTSAYQYMQDVLTVDVKFPRCVSSASPLSSPSKCDPPGDPSECELPCVDLWLDLLSGMLQRDATARLTAQQAHAKAKELQRYCEEHEQVKLGLSIVSDRDIKHAFTTRRQVHPMPTPTPSV